MTKVTNVPTTIGELVDLLSKYPRNAKLNVSIVEIYDNGSVYPTDSFSMKIENYDDYGDSGAVNITFADGWTLDKE